MPSTQHVSLSGILLADLWVIICLMPHIGACVNAALLHTNFSRIVIDYIRLNLLWFSLDSLFSINSLITVSSAFTDASIFSCRWKYESSAQSVMNPKYERYLIHFKHSIFHLNRLKDLKFSSFK